MSEIEDKKKKDVEDEVKESPGKPKDKTSGVSKFLNFFKDLRGEIIMLFFALSNFLPVIFLQQFVLMQVCKREFPQINCTQEFNATIEAKIQHAASNLLLWLFLVRTVPSFLILLFWGPWSDIHGRFLPIFAPMIGHLISSILYLLANEFNTWPLYTLVLAAIPAGVTGDYSTFMMGYFGWINDIYSIDELTIRMSSVNGVETLMLILAPYVGSVLYKTFSFTAVFATSAICMAIGCVFVCFFVKDERYKSAPLKILLLDMINLRKVLGIFKTLCAKREDRKTLHMNLMLLSIIPAALSFFGHQEIIYLLLRLVASIDVYTFSIYSTVQGTTNAIGFLIVAPILVHLFKLEDTVLGFIGNIAFMAYYISTGLLTSITALFAVCTLQIPGIISLLTTRSFVSKCVSSSERGKAMSLVGLCQVGGHVLGIIAARQTYKNTLHTFPGLFHVIAGLILIVCIIINGYIYIDMKRIKKASAMNDDTKVSETQLKTQT